MNEYGEKSKEELAWGKACAAVLETYETRHFIADILYGGLGLDSTEEDLSVKIYGLQAKRTAALHIVEQLKQTDYERFQLLEREHAQRQGYKLKQHKGTDYA